jgi:hypothetical protein
MKMTASAEAAAILVCVLITLATSVLARPPVPSYSFEEYTDNNILGSQPDDAHDDGGYGKSDREEVLEM